MVVSDNFNLFMPFDVVKSEKGGQSEPEMRIAGYASTSDKDRQNDIIIQKGLDISNFVNYVQENGLNDSLDTISGQIGVSVKNLNRFLEYEDFKPYKSEINNIGKKGNIGNTGITLN